MAQESQVRERRLVYQSCADLFFLQRVPPALFLVAFVLISFVCAPQIDVKIQEMREQAEHRDKVLAELERSRAALQEELSGLSRQREQLAASSFPGRAAALAGSMPQFATAAQQYRDGLGKMLQQTELLVSQQQEMLIALNALASAANNPKLQKKYKKALAKLEPQLALLRTQVQQNILQKRQAVEVRGDLIKDLDELLLRKK